MEWSELTSIAATVILSLGGGGAIVLGFSNWIGKILGKLYVERIKHEIHQEIESYKTKLKKSEFLFQKEFEAASSFISLRLDLLPEYSFPDMEWDSTCQEFARNFAIVEKQLEKYIATHGAALQQRPLERLSSAIGAAAEWKFDVSRERVPLQAIEVAAMVIENMEKVENELREAVWSQSST